MLVIDENILVLDEDLYLATDDEGGAEWVEIRTWMFEHCCGEVTDLLGSYCSGCGMRLY